MENWSAYHDSYFVEFYCKFTAVFQILFRDSFDSVAVKNHLQSKTCVGFLFIVSDILITGRK